MEAKHSWVHSRSTLPLAKGHLEPPGAACSRALPQLGCLQPTQHRYVTPTVGTSLGQGSPPCCTALALNSGLRTPQLHLHSVPSPAEATPQSRLPAQLQVTAVLSPLELSCHPNPAECLPGPQWDCAPLGSPKMSVLHAPWDTLSPFKVSTCLHVSPFSPMQFGSARVPRQDWV